MSVAIEGLEQGVRVPVQTKVIGVDLDDTAFFKQVGARIFVSGKELLFGSALPSKSLEDIPQLDHTPVDRTLSSKEKISFLFHSRRMAIPGMAEMIREEIDNGTAVYGISGRKATKAWYEMSEAQLKRANIPLTALYLSPRGVSGLESKADSIRRLGITDFYEDDKRTLLYLAKLFPHVRFNYIDHGLVRLAEKDLAENTNISVIPILNLSGTKKTKEGDESAVRNSDLRKKTDFMNPLVESFHETFPKVKAWHVTAAGVGFSAIGIALAEHQNRTGKYRRITTALAGISLLIGSTLDLLDGKLARLIRSKMTDVKARDKDEEIGQALDPLGDGLVEGWQAISSAITAKKHGKKRAVTLALFRLGITNIPRTAKAVLGCFGISVPENYRFKNLLKLDPRPLGTSLGRKGLNHPSTFINPENVPIQPFLDAASVVANTAVAGDRIIGTLLTSAGRTLSDKEIRHARTRAKILGIESLLFIGAAFILGKILLPKKKK